MKQMQNLRIFPISPFLSAAFLLANKNCSSNHFSAPISALYFYFSYSHYSRSIINEFALCYCVWHSALVWKQSV